MSRTLQIKHVLQGQVKDHHLQEIGNGLTMLTRLGFSAVNCTDQGLRHLSGLAQLRELELRRAHEVTDAGLQHLASALPALVQVSLFEAPRVSPNALDAHQPKVQLQMRGRHAGSK